MRSGNIIYVDCASGHAKHAAFPAVFESLFKRILSFFLAKKGKGLKQGSGTIVCKNIFLMEHFINASGMLVANHVCYKLEPINFTGCWYEQWFSLYEGMEE